MTDDPMLEKLLTVSNQDIRLHCGEFTAAEIRAAKAVLAYVRSRMAGKRIVEDVPVAWTKYASNGIREVRIFSVAEPEGLKGWEPLYAAPSDAEVGNG